MIQGGKALIPENPQICHTGRPDSSALPLPPLSTVKVKGRWTRGPFFAKKALEPSGIDPRLESREIIFEMGQRFAIFRPGYTDYIFCIFEF